MEDEQRKIGVVVGAQAYSWFEVEVVGRDSHAETTPLPARKGAFLAALKMIVASNKIAEDSCGLIITGTLSDHPGSVNTLPRTVRFTLDIRHSKTESLANMVGKCRQEFFRIAKEESGKGVDVN